MMRQVGEGGRGAVGGTLVTEKNLMSASRHKRRQHSKLTLAAGRRQHEGKGAGDVGGAWGVRRGATIKT